MIESLRIDNLVIVEHAELDLGSGMTCITGETGAGKSLLATAVGLLLGGDATAGMVGPDAPEAWVEATFRLDAETWELPAFDALRDLAPTDPLELTLARQLYATGRTRALAWGRTITRDALAEAGAVLVTVAGQHGQRRIARRKYQRDILDAASGEAGRAARERMRSAWDELVSAREAREDLQRSAETLEQRRAQIVDDERRIAEVAPSIDDESALVGRRDAVRNRAAIQAAVVEALSTLDGDQGASMQLALAARALERPGDGPAGQVAAELLAAQEQVSEAIRELHRRLDAVAEAEVDAAQVEERLAAYDELHRRFGGTTAAVLDRWQTLRRQRDLLGDLGGELARADADVAAAESAAVEAAERLSSLRAAAAARIAKAMSGELAAMGMEDAQVEWQLEPCDLTASGADRVELLLAANAGIRPAPVSQIASGGELSRIALALQVATGSCESATLIFDEVDAGIGGSTAHAVGDLLARLGERAQVLCITHLPQVAARADAIVRVDKSRGRTRVERLVEDAEMVTELARMAGAAPSDAAAMAHARELRTRRFVRRGAADAAAGDRKRR